MIDPSDDPTFEPTEQDLLRQREAEGYREQVEREDELEAADADEERAGHEDGLLASQERETWTFGVESYDTADEAAQSVAEWCVTELENAKLGEVYGPGDGGMGHSVSVYVEVRNLSAPAQVWGSSPALKRLRELLAETTDACNAKGDALRELVAQLDAQPNAVEDMGLDLTTARRLASVGTVLPKADDGARAALTALWDCFEAEDDADGGVTLHANVSADADVIAQVLAALGIDLQGNAVPSGGAS